MRCMRCTASEDDAVLKSAQMGRPQGGRNVAADGCDASAKKPTHPYRRCEKRQRGWGTYDDKTLVFKAMWCGHCHKQALRGSDTALKATATKFVNNCEAQKRRKGAPFGKPDLPDVFQFSFCV